MSFLIIIIAIDSLIFHDFLSGEKHIVTEYLTETVSIPSIIIFSSLIRNVKYFFLKNLTT